MIPLVGPIGTALLDKAANAGNALLGNTASPGQGPGTSFAALVGDAVGQVTDNLQQAEQLSVASLRGEGDMRAVVDAVMSAEQSLQAALAIRDKIVSAYLEISRMAI